jgi:hypothetical protein
LDVHRKGEYVSVELVIPPSCHEQLRAKQPELISGLILDAVPVLKASKDQRLQQVDHEALERDLKLFIDAYQRHLKQE